MVEESSSDSEPFARLTVDTTVFRGIDAMKEIEGLNISAISKKVTSVFVAKSQFKSCGRCLLFIAGGSVHLAALKTGFDSDRYINNTLVRMYAAFGDMGCADKVFDEMTERDVVSWSCMIAAYLTCKYPLDALSVYQDMKLANIKPNSVTLVSLLYVCSHLVNIKMGESIHSYIVTNDIKLDVSLATTLIEMYSACGYIEKALVIFNSMSDINPQSWSIMITGLAENGHGEEAISLFNQMEDLGFTSDTISFSGILSACSHLGLVETGQKYFDQMVNLYTFNCESHGSKVFITVLL
ncbi:pentatricopeptide repeat-containing protein At2g34400-like [Bidens hawaiensis]|uniref:pentatricopeptide repeat-containing protein At2g34400-like n=1 Tax=Bidens hawaiensis TaxID=980011 RepID=UPI0040490BD3